MSFNFEGGKAQDNTKPKVDVDFQALNQHIVDEVKCEEPEVVKGVVAGIVDLGLQSQPDGQYALEGDDIGKTVEQLNKTYAEQLADGSITKFEIAYNSETKQREVMKFVPRKPQQSVDLLIDFPEILVNKGKFYGKEDAEPKPYRMSLGGQFWQKSKGENGVMLLQKLTPLRLTNIGDDTNKIWSMSPLSVLHKMAVDGGLIKKGEAFVPQQITDLLGKTYQFQIQAFFKEGRNGKSYFTENIKYVGKLPRGGEPFEDYPTFCTQFNPLADEDGKQANDQEALKQLRAVQISQMQQSPAFAESVIVKELGDKVNPKNAPQKEKTEDNLNVGNGVDLDDANLPF